MSGLVELLLLLLFGFFSTPDYSISQLEDMNAHVTANPNGKAYEEKLVHILSKEASIRNECNVLRTMDKHLLTVYLVITQEGNIEQVYTEKENDVSRCITKSIKGKIAPQPPSDFVAKIKL